MISTAIDLFKEDPSFWIPSSDSTIYIPHLAQSVLSGGPSSADPIRHNAFVKYGYLLALYVTREAQWPSCISPIVLFLLVLDLDRVLSLEPQLLSEIDTAGWHSYSNILTWQPNSPRPSQLSHPLVNFLIEIMNVQNVRYPSRFYHLLSFIDLPSSSLLTVLASSQRTAFVSGR